MSHKAHTFAAVSCGQPGHARSAGLYVVADIEVEVQLYASPIELGSAPAIVVEHHDICGEKDGDRVICLEFAVPDCGRGLAGVKKVVGIAFSLWGAGRSRRI